MIFNQNAYGFNEQEYIDIFADQVHEIELSYSYIGGGVFSNHSNLKSVKFPMCTSIGSMAFCDCFSLTEISFPQCTSIEYGAFSNCSKLTTAPFPQCTSIGNYAFEFCSSLTTISFPQCTYIGNGAFHSCHSLIEVYLNSTSTICSIYNSSIFPDSFKSSGTVYVPSSLYTAYCSAQYWSTFSSRIVSI